MEFPEIKIKRAEMKKQNKTYWMGFTAAETWKKKRPANLKMQQYKQFNR